MTCLIADLEVFIFRIYGDIQNFCFAYIAAEVLFNVLYTMADIAGFTLRNHFYRPVRQITDKAGQLVAVGRSKGGKTKPNALYRA